jgi:ribosomal-protein-alanine N-acetyltransferase
MVRRDLKQIDDIERSSFEHPWLNDDFCLKLSEDGVLCYVVEHDNSIVAYAVVKYFGDYIEICSMAVSPYYRRQKIASLIVDMLKIKLSLERRSHILAYIDEYNLPAQLFFRDNGFVADDVMYDYYSHGRSAYRMCF